MRANVAAPLAGVVFAVGLGLSGMTQPAKVFGFLDLAGAWDPSLMMVMVGGIGVNAAAYWMVVRRREAPVLEARFLLPTRTDIDVRLVAGAAIFGVGWGLGGFCPGPGIVSLAGGGVPALVFVGAMLAGMGMFAAWERLRA